MEELINKMIMNYILLGFLILAFHIFNAAMFFVIIPKKLGKEKRIWFKSKKHAFFWGAYHLILVSLIIYWIIQAFIMLKH